MTTRLFVSAVAACATTMVVTASSSPHGARMPALAPALEAHGIVSAGAAAASPPGAAQGTLAAQGASGVSTDDAGATRALLDRYCVTCHNQRSKTANLQLDTLDVGAVVANAEVWEKVIGKVRGGSMPPPGLPRPDGATLTAFVQRLERTIDTAAAQAPDPGRPALHRLNRSEYANAVRDLFGLNADVRTLLPADDSGYGFDNIGDVLSVSSGLMERYLSAARVIARLAVGDPDIRPTVQTFKAPKNDRQENRNSEDAPFGTRGGMAFEYLAPLDGTYAFKVRILRTVGDQDYIRGLHRRSVVDVRLDGDRVLQFAIGGQLGCPVQGLLGKGCFEPLGGALAIIVPDEPETVQFRLPLDAGTHRVAAAFAAQTLEAEGLKPRYPTSHYTFQNEIEGLTFIESVDVNGPYDPKPPSNTMSSRQKIFICAPPAQEDDRACAERVLTRLARYAYRGTATPDDVRTLLAFYDSGRAGSRPFDAGIQAAMVRLLVSPRFLFRAERDPQAVAKGGVYNISDLDLASRLSFFLWSSIPDEPLLEAAERGRLHDPQVLAQQVGRMLADQRSEALTTNFAGQWLLLRNLQAVTPDTHEFPEFDDELREAARRETELFFDSQLRENRPVPELLSADYTFLNERLARHYGIPQVYGRHFRRVPLADEHRRGLLGQASILTVTSYPNRTSPVLRGKWVLENILGSPPPAPPPNVPALEEQPAVKYKTMRERMEAHRKNPVCASCHARIDPIGFAMENFDGIGQWRERMGEESIDVSGRMDGVDFAGVAELRGILMQHQEQFVASVARKLMTYALGRGVEYTDMPSLRQVLESGRADDYRWNAIVLGIVNSTAFRMRRADS